MDFLTLAMWIATVAFLALSFAKDKNKTKQALKIALSMGKGMAASIITIIFVIGLILTLIPPQEIAGFIAKQQYIAATVIAAAVGTVTLVPAFIAFPLVGTLIGAGVGIVPAVSFLTTLTMVGVVTIPLEQREFGTKFTIIRNSVSFIFAIIIALLMGVLL